MMISITSEDEELIALLRLNAREPIASLARKLGLSRTTVQDRLRRLEQSGTIAGYAVKLGSEVVRAIASVSSGSCSHSRASANNAEFAAFAGLDQFQNQIRQSAR